MQVTTNNLPKSQVELLIQLSIEEFQPYIQKGADRISKSIKIDGFRPGKAPYKIVKSKIGEITILEEAARIAIAKIIDQAIIDHVKKRVIGQPQISITKLAPGNPLEFKVIATLLPSLELGEYKNLKIKKQTAKVDDKEIDSTISQLREMRVIENITDKAAKDSNKIIINIEMFLDNVPVEGGQSKDATIIIGKDYVVPGLDKELLNLKKDDTKEFKLPYPADHHMRNLAGKIVSFKVKVVEVYDRLLPELDDSFAKNFGLKKIDELKTNIKKSIEQEKQRDLNQKSEIEILEQIIEKTKFDDLPEDLVNSEANQMMSELQNNIKRQGGKFDDYLLSIKKTQDQLLLDTLPQAVKRVKSALAIQKIAEQENINIKDEEVEKKRQELLTQYKGNSNVEDRVREPAYATHLRVILTNKKVMEQLLNWNLV